MKKENKLIAFFKRYSVVDMIRVSCGALLAFILIFLTSKEESWFVALMFSFGLFTIYFINGYLDNVKPIRNALYVVEFVALMVYGFFYPTKYLSTVYSLVLVDFYLKNSMKMSLIFGISCFVGYIITDVLGEYYYNGTVNYYALITDFTIDIVVFVLVFCMANMLYSIIQKNEEISKNLSELALREQKLKEANEKIKEATLLEERNRIAKQIHDTTGHSITNIIMQTEAAKLEIDKDKESAKEKIISANMQAVLALEELRRSVHVLSGQNETFDLSTAIGKAVAETTENTGIAIRAKYPENIAVNNDLGFFIYSSFKEGLNNGIRHGKSNAFVFDIKIIDGIIHFLLSDNGIGTDTLSLGYGLKSMKEKAESFGGSITFTSQSGEGFDIEMLLPMNTGE